MSDDRVWFVAERFEQLRDLLFEFGYALDPGPRDPNEWHELRYDEPPTGVVRLKGVRLPELEDDDSDFDPEITFSIEELWSPEYVDGAQSKRGYYLVECSYHAHYHGIDQRWDFDPTRHPKRPTTGIHQAGVRSGERLAHRSAQQTPYRNSRTGSMSTSKAHAQTSHSGEAALSRLPPRCASALLPETVRESLQVLGLAVLSRSYTAGPDGAELIESFPRAFEPKSRTDLRGRCDYAAIAALIALTMSPNTRARHDVPPVFPWIGLLLARFPLIAATELARRFVPGVEPALDRAQRRRRERWHQRHMQGREVVFEAAGGLRR